MQKVILDTDIGSDIDDAVCLAYLLAKPECELMGITTVSGEPVKRASLASALCKVAGQDIPIYPGIEMPLIRPQNQPKASQFDALTNWDYDTDFPNAEAITFMQKTIRENPGEITLLAIGPMTNLAVLFAMDPEITSLLKSLVLMCGQFLGEGRNPEWNAKCDHHATEIVYRQRPTVFRSVGIDVTKQVKMPAEEVRDHFSKIDLLKPVLDFAEVWFTHTPMITFHDPLTAVCLFDEQVCEFEKGDVAIEMEDKEKLGLTHWNQIPTGPHEIATKVDVDRFFDLYFGVF